MNYSGVQVEVPAEKGIYMLRDLSGTGKSFLFTILLSYFTEKKVSYCF